jgi:hypothetical protein
LVGMVAYDLTNTGDLTQIDLFGTLLRQRRLEVAVDNLIERFGTDIVHRAHDLGNLTSPSLDTALISWTTEPRSGSRLWKSQTVSSQAANASNISALTSESWRPLLAGT